MRRHKRQMTDNGKHAANVLVLPGRVIRARRKEMGWKASDLARKSGVNARTLSAIEMGRIELPSLKHLHQISTSLGISIAALFAAQQKNPNLVFFVGNQKGTQKIDYLNDGFKIICYTPHLYELFVGKVILEGERRISREKLPLAGMLFVQTLLGKLAVVFEGKEHVVKEGGYVFLDGCLSHEFYNPLQSETSFLLVTAPSIFASPSPAQAA